MKSENQFKRGDAVRLKRDSSEQVREVLAVIDGENGVVYQVSSVEVDIEKKTLVNGVVTVTGDELEAVKKVNTGGDQE